MSDETVWNWLQAKGKMFKVISNPNKGTIEVINDKGETLIRKTNMSKKQVELVEKNFLNIVAKRINDNNKTVFRKPGDSFDPMIV